MLFQSQYEEAEQLCLDISVCRIMNFSWNTKVSDTHTHTPTLSQSNWVDLRALFGCIYYWKRQTVQACAPFYRELRNDLHFSTLFCFLSSESFISLSAQLIRHVSHSCFIGVLLFYVFLSVCRLSVCCLFMCFLSFCSVQCCCVLPPQGHRTWEIKVTQHIQHMSMNSMFEDPSNVGAAVCGLKHIML